MQLASMSFVFFADVCTNKIAWTDNLKCNNVCLTVSTPYIDPMLFSAVSQDFILEIENKNDKGMMGMMNVSECQPTRHEHKNGLVLAP